MTEARYILRTTEIRSRVCRVIMSLPAEPVCQIEIRPWRKVRSQEQNRRYFALLKILALEMSRQMDGEYHPPEVWHEWAKAEFIGRDTLVVDGSPVLVQKSSAKLTVLEFLDYTEQVEAWAAEHGIVLGDDA